MSQDIISTKFYDPNVDQIRQATNQLEDKYPFLLMPVRLETKFMRVDRPVAGYENADDIEILNLILELQYLFERMELIGIMELVDAKNVEGRIIEIIDILTGKMDEPWTLPWPENEYWEENRDSILETYDDLTAKYNNLSSTAKNIYDQVSGTLTNAVEKVQELEVSKATSTEFKNAKTMIDKLNRVEEVFDQIIEKPGDYTPKTKHDYFNFLESKTAAIKQVCNDIESLAMKNILANTNQINRIKEFSAVYSSKMPQTRNVFSNIQSEFKRNEFLGKYENELEPALDNFTTSLNEIITPKLEYVHELKTVKSASLLYQAKRLQFELENINFEGLANYQQIKQTRTHLYGMLRKFRATAHDIIVGPSWQIGQLKTTWSRVDDLLDDYTQIVAQVPVSGQYQRAGRTRTISHLNENYRADLASFKQESAQDSVVVQNSSLIESANSLNLANEKLKELASEVVPMAGEGPNQNQNKVVAAAQKLVEFSQEFAVLTTKTTVIPEVYYKEIYRGFNTLKQAVHTIVANAQDNPNLHQPTMNMSNAMQAAQHALQELESDITDEKDPFYDDFRKKTIYGDLTETVDELWVRIYPDDIFVASHEKAVTQEEYDDTAYFWTEVWNGGDDKEVELAAWRVLALKYGENRADYLRQIFNPAKRQQPHPRPSRPMAEAKHRISSAIEKIDTILGYELLASQTIEDGLGPIFEELNGCINLINTLSTETFVLLNSTTDQTNLVKQKMDALNILVQNWQGDPLYAQVHFHIDYIYQKINEIANALSQIKPVDDVTLLSSTIVPIFSTSIQIKDSPWTEPPQSHIMPERFVFLGMNGGVFTHIKVGKQIPDPLIVGINPVSFDAGSFEYDENGNLMLDENTKWLVDFEEAVEKGMGIAVPLSGTEKIDGFEKIIVLGIKDTDADDSKSKLEELLEAHSFSPDGTSILPLGTPTNNTDKKTSGFSSDDDADKKYERITGDPLFNGSESDRDNIDGFRIKEALGLKMELFDKLENADKQDTYKSLLMNKALWNSTMGYYMEEVMDTIFNLDNIKRTKDYFTNYVTGRGWLPALRIGSQPYGVLPTTAFSRYRAYPNQQMPPIDNTDFVNMPKSTLNQVLQKRFNIRLYKLMNIIREQWMGIVNHEDVNLKIDDFNPEYVTAQEHFMQLLGLQATSIEQYFRYNTNTAQRRSVAPDIGSTVNFSATDLYGPYNMNVLYGQLVNEGNFIDDTYYRMVMEKNRPSNMSDADFEAAVALNRIKESRIFRLRYHDDFGVLDGPFVRENDDNFLLRNSSGDTFVDKLFSTSPETLWNQESFGALNSNSLFFMFIRQSLALTYREVALDILTEEGLINENTRRRAGSKGTYLIPGPNRKDIIFTKWDYLFQELAGFDNMTRPEFNPYKNFPFSGNLTQSSLWDDVASNQGTFGKYLHHVLTGQPGTNTFGHDFSKLTGLKDQFMEIKDLPIDELERLFAEHLDLCTYRFDAWQLGLANKRLNAMRKKSVGREGIYLGAFGWLEDLKPGEEGDVVTNVPEQLRENENKLVYSYEDNEGFIHTPSINHALTAAILRSGYISNIQAGDLNNPMAVNLTSKRVRMGLKLMQGIRNGQETGALLGYQFERGLHENYLSINLELDEFIYPLRRKFPLVPDVGGQVDENVNEEQSTMNVVDGLKLLEAVRGLLADDLVDAESLYQVELDHADQLRSHLELPSNIPNSKRNAIFKEIDAMANAFDALGDLLMSESVYHIAQGNYVRSAAVFAALADGKVPPDVQIIDTPRTGHVLTQRMILQLETITEADINNSPQQHKPQGWENIDFTARSLAEPSLNKWLGEMIGNPAQIRCYVVYNQNETSQTTLVRLLDLGLQPIDAVYLLGNAEEDAGNELNKLIAYYVRNMLGLPMETELSINFKKRNDRLVTGAETLTADIKTFHEVMPLFSSLFETITRSRFTNAEDYVVPGENIPPDRNLFQLDVIELQLRIDGAFATFDQLRDDLKAVFGTKGVNYKDPILVKEAIYSTTDISSFKTYLMQCPQFGLPEVIPDSAIETDNVTGKAIAKQAAAAVMAMDEKLTRTSLMMNFGEELSDKIKVDKLIDAGKILFGKSAVIIPHFKLRNAQELFESTTLPHNDGLLLYADDYAVDGWVEGISKVRPKVNKLEMVNTMTSMFNTAFPDYKPVQLPYDVIENENGEQVGDYWLGLEYPADYEPENDKLSLVLLNEGNLNADNPNASCCGLLIDEWIEIIPEREETTGITFNYDQPDAEPPQSLLLAVPPVETGNWDWDDLVYTILDTMDLYKARLVEPEHIDKSIFTQVLPAVMGEFPAPNEYRNHVANLGMFDLAENNAETNE